MSGEINELSSPVPLRPLFFSLSVRSMLGSWGLITRSAQGESYLKGHIGKPYKTRRAVCFGGGRAFRGAGSPPGSPQFPLLHSDNGNAEG